MVLSTRVKVLIAVAGAIGVYVVVSGPDASTTSVTQADSSRARTAAAPTRADPRSAARERSPDNANLLVRLAHRVTSSNAVESLFHTQSWYVAPPPPPPAPVVEVAPPPPTAPPLPFSVMGSYARPGDSKVYFLTRGDRVFDVHIGDTIDNTYSVDAETDGALVLTYKPLNIKQTLALGGTQ